MLFTPLAPRLALALAVTFGSSHLMAAAGADWATYLGDKSASHYSTLNAITPENVRQLEVAWTWNAGDARGDQTQIQCNPLIIGGVLYATTPQLKVVALEAATGRELWRFQPPEANGVNRGLAYWSNGDERHGQWPGSCDHGSRL